LQRRLNKVISFAYSIFNLLSVKVQLAIVIPTLTTIQSITYIRGITLSSVFGKIFDLVFLNKFYDYLCTSERQFGFKRRHSTDMCTMILKESLAYYTVDGGAAFCTFLDATKAFDRVNYCKLFSILVKRNILAAYVRLLWNGVCSRTFSVKNGVRQGGIISPILFLCLHRWSVAAMSLVSAVISGMSSSEHWLTRMMWSCSLLHIVQCVGC